MSGDILTRGDSPVTFPVASGELLRLIADLGYEPDRAFIADLITRGRIKGPDEVELWEREAVLELIGGLEALRKWIPGHQAHASKQNDYWRIYLGARATNKLAELVLAFDKHSSRELVLLMLDGDRQQREDLAALLCARLDYEGAR